MRAVFFHNAIVGDLNSITQIQARLLSYLTNKLGCFYRTGKKVRGPSDFLSENQLMGPQERIDVKKILQNPWHHPSTWG